MATLLVLFASVGPSTGCVKKELYSQALSDLQFERRRSTELEKKLEAVRGEIAALTTEMAQRDAALESCSLEKADLARKLDETNVMNVALTERLRSAGQSLDQASSEKGSLSEQLSETRKQLDELRKQQQAAEARVAQFQELVKRFQKLADAGKLRVVLRQGRMIIELPTDVLFDSGRSDVKAPAKETLLEVGKILASMPDRHFQVAGHTDNVDIHTAKFPSNWELSAGRAIEVVKVLMDANVKPENLSAAGYGEFDPVTSNENTEGKQKNRRIEVSLVPNLDEFVRPWDPKKQLPEAATKPADFKHTETKPVGGQVRGPKSQ